jgi:hypothetical protein
VYVPIPASVATAVIPLTAPPPPNTYLDIAIVATRNGIPIPVDSEFYNVIVTSQASLPTPDQYQGIDLTLTSFYLTLPPPPLTTAIGLVIPSDGSAPQFDQLFPAMQQAAQNDPYFPPGIDLTALSVDQCTRMAYDSVWSEQNVLPLPPDPLEELYTNPPNTGGSAGSSGNDNGDEQDRQKFEGTLNSFYSTRNATAVRLTKFVAAASGALYCEQTSVEAGRAILEFLVDPTDFADPSPVESEVLLTGLSAITSACPPLSSMRSEPTWTRAPRATCVIRWPRAMRSSESSWHLGTQSRRDRSKIPKHSRRWCRRRPRRRSLRRRRRGGFPRSR